jgi:hypothetical protein
MNQLTVKALLPLFLLSTTVLTAQAHTEQDTLWHIHTANKATNTMSSQHFTLDESRLAQDLTQAQYTQVRVPGPDGVMHTFRLSDAGVMPAKLAAKFPNIRAFTGININEPSLTGRFNFSSKGMSAMFDAPLDGDLERIFIDPIMDTDNEYRSYKVTPEARQLAQQRFTKYAPKVMDVNRLFEPSVRAQKTGQPNTTQDSITYRLAMTANGEYTQYHGGTVADAMTEIVIMVNRLNDIFEVELGVTLQLVDDNDQLIFTNATTDPFNNDSQDGDLNQTVTDNRIGTANYDIGHIVNTNGGGLAVLGALCWDGYKADGITGSGSPTNDAFWVDFVAHELGHQFGANHTFNATTGSCGGGNRESEAAYEVGAGTTIMSYAGICGEQNITGQVDDYYHVHSLNEMAAEIEFARQNTPNCGIRIASQNTHPQANAGSDYIIPANTPFILTGEATDANTTDTLTYSWEQYDLGTATSSKLDDETDNGDGPLFRSLSPSNGPQRYFPKKISALQRLTSNGETLPTTNRDLNFQFTVRDNQGGSSSDQMQLTVIDTGTAFEVTSPARNDVYTSNPITVAWTVAGTDQAPINCTTVDIELSNNTGGTYPLKLAANVPNNGSALVNLPGTDGEQRFQNIRVVCSNNIFYSPSEGVFSSNITAPPAVIITGQNTLSVAEDTSLTLLINNFTFSEAPDIITVQPGENYAIANNSITPATNFTGILSVNVVATLNGQTSSVFVASVTVTPVNDAPVAIEDVAIVTQNTANNMISILANDTDVDSSDTLTVISTQASAGGNITIVATGINYTPAEDFIGIETINYTISDGTAQASSTLTVTVEEPVPNIPPLTTADTASAETMQTVTVDVLSNDTDGNGDTLTITDVRTSGSGTVTVINNQVQYISAANFVGSEVLTYDVTDGIDSVSETITISVSAPAVNSPPIAVADTATTTTGTTVNVLVLANDTDTEGDTLTLSSAVTNGSGAVSVVGNNIRYVSAANFTGNEVITYTLSDGSNTATGTLTVTVNAAPTPTPTPPSTGGSSGGSMSFFALLSLLIIATRRGLRLQQG